eukprot:g1102.t1
MSAAAFGSFDVDDLKRTLRSGSRFEQSDAVSEVFRRWYEVAKTYAKSDEIEENKSPMTFVTRVVFETLLGDEGDLTRKDPFAVSAIAEHLVKLLQILRTKPKFTCLLQQKKDDAFSDLCAYVGGACASRVTSTIVSSHVATDSRMAMVRVLLEIIYLRNAIGGTRNPLHMSDDRLHALVRVATSMSSNSTDSAISVTGTNRLQSELLRALRAISLKATSSEEDCDPDDRSSTALVGPAQTGNRVRAALARAASDSNTLRSLWAIGALRCASDVRTLAHRACKNMMTASAVVDSLRAAVVDMQSGGSDRDESRGETLDCVSDAMCELVIACDAALTRADGGGKRCPAVLRLIEAVLDVARSSSQSRGFVQRFVRMLLSAPGSTREDDDDDDHAPDLDSLSLLTRVAPSLDERTWTSTLLPYISNALKREESERVDLKTTGRASKVTRTDSFDSVGGGVARFSEEEQELVNLLHEGVRSLYAAHRRRRPTLAVGRLCFDAVLRAMCEGYTETERFPELATLVLGTHFDDDEGSRGSGEERGDSVGWLREAMESAEFDSPNAARAILAIVRHLAMPEAHATSSFATSTRRALACAALARVARSESRLSNEIWIDLLARVPSIARDHPEAVSRLLDKLARGARESSLKSNLSDRDSATKLLDVLATSSILPSDAAPALLRALLAHFDAESTIESDDCARATMSVRLSDDSLVAALRRIDRVDDKADESLRRHVGRLCAHASTDVRCQVARLLPMTMIRDPSAVVFAVAMRALGQRAASLTRPDAEDILLQCRSLGERDEDAGSSSSLDVHELDVLNAIVPTLVTAAKTFPDLVGAVVERLGRALKVTANNDSEHRADVRVVNALDRVAREVADADALDAFVKEAYGSALLARVRRVSRVWDARVQDCLERGVVRRLVDGASNRAKSAMRSLNSSSYWLDRLRRARTEEPVACATKVGPVSDNLPVARPLAADRSVGDEDVILVEASVVDVDDGLANKTSTDALEYEIRRWEATPARAKEDST